jgi:hypothetical protein
MLELEVPEHVSRTDAEAVCTMALRLLETATLERVSSQSVVVVLRGHATLELTWREGPRAFGL